MPNVELFAGSLVKSRTELGAELPTVASRGATVMVGLPEKRSHGFWRGLVDEVVASYLVCGLAKWLRKGSRWPPTRRSRRPEGLEIRLTASPEEV